MKFPMVQKGSNSKMVGDLDIYKTRGHHIVSELFMILEQKERSRVRTVFCRTVHQMVPVFDLTIGLVQSAVVQFTLLSIFIVTNNR